MQEIDRSFARGVRRLAERRDLPEFTGKIVLNCANGRLQNFSVTERHESRVDKVEDITETGSGT